MASDTDIVWRLRADIASALQGLVGKTFLPVPIPYAPTANINAADFGPRQFPKITVLDDDQIASALDTEDAILIDSVSITATERAEQTEQGISQLVVPSVGGSTGLGADASNARGGLDTGGALDAASSPSVPVLTVSVDPTTNIATIGGAIRAGDVIGAQLGLQGVGYCVVATDTFSSVATALAAELIALGCAVTASGATILPPATGDCPTYAVGATFMGSFEAYRYRRVFQAELRMTNKADREIATAPIAALYDPNGVGCWLDMPDGTQATVLSMDVHDAAKPEYLTKADKRVWLRTINFSVEYELVQPVQFTSVVAVNLNPQGSVLAPALWEPTPANQL